MSIKLKDVIHMQKMSTLAITPSGKEYWFYTENSYTSGPTLMELTDEEMQILESTIIKMETYESGSYGAVFHITEPEIKEKSITVEDATKLSSDIIFIYQEKHSYATKPSEKMKQSVKNDFDIDDVEILPKSMYSMYIDQLTVDCITGSIEAYLK